MSALNAFCAAAGLQCVAHFGGDVNCVKETHNVFGCDEINGNLTDWCECRGEADPPQPARCEAQAGSLSIGQTYTVDVDAHTGDEATTEPKVDANNGLGGDNPRFRRQNVARAYNDYWYTSSHQAPGEPNPASEQWVDYTPDFGALGIGCYHVVARYRATSSRATYPAQYRVINSGAGDVLIERVQLRVDGAYIDEGLGNHVLCSNAYVRIQDPGSDSITFNEMRFVYQGPTCP